MINLETGNIFKVVTNEIVGVRDIYDDVPTGLSNLVYIFSFNLFSIEEISNTFLDNILNACDF